MAARMLRGSARDRRRRSRRGPWLAAAAAAAALPAAIDRPACAQPPASAADRVPAAVAGEPILMRAALSHTAYSRRFPETLALKIDLAAASGRGPHASMSIRPPLNIALVIDGSASMAEAGKFGNAMLAARLVIENLTDGDVISVITFNQKSTALFPAGRAVNKELLNRRLGEIVPQGWSNLSAGLLEAFAQIVRYASAEQTKRVIVLTDGQANRGITDPARLAGLIQTSRLRGISVSTMGVGDQFDERVLIELAAAGGGRYTYIREPEQIPQAMRAELEGLLNVVAQNVRVEVDVPEALRITGAGGRATVEPAGTAVFEIGDVREGERGVLLLTLAPGDFLAGEPVTIRCTLTFDRTDVGRRVRRIVTLEAVALKDRDEALIARSADRNVILYAGVTDAVQRAEDALLGLDMEGFNAAAALFKQHFQDARHFAIDTHDQQLLNRTVMLADVMQRLTEAGESGRLYDHRDERRRLRREVEYRRYLSAHDGGRYE